MTLTNGQKPTQYKCLTNIMNIQSNLSYVTFQGKIEIWSYKTGNHLIQV
jgi:hypothetical protein